jgi:hypothetical protein
LNQIAVVVAIVKFVSALSLVAVAVVAPAQTSTPVRDEPRCVYQLVGNVNALVCAGDDVNAGA